MCSSDLTPFGEWANRQPTGVLTRAMRQTKLSWSTVCKARKKRMSRDVAEVLSRFTGGEVKPSQIVKKRVSAQ